MFTEILMCGDFTICVCINKIDSVVKIEGICAISGRDIGVLAL